MDQTIFEKAQDGGLVSGITAWGLDSGRWASVVAFTRDFEWKVHPIVATDYSGIKDSCGSKYTYTSIVEALEELRDRGLSTKPFAIVGLPCHISAVRRLKKLRSKYLDGLDFCIGLFCSKAFSYEGLVKNRLEKEMGLSIQNIRKMDIRKGAFTVEMVSGEEHQIPIKELSEYGHPGCALCCDFSAEEADLSAGGLGIGDWTIGLIRNEAAQASVDGAAASGFIETQDAGNFSEAFQVLEKLSARKRRLASKRMTSGPKP
jgi:coenzyme F420 hydrogenase subunit beta